MTVSTTKRVMVVDANPLTRFGLISVVNLNPMLSACGEAGDARTASALFSNQRPDCVIIDVIVPNGDGIELISHFKNLNPSLCAIVVTDLDDLSSIRRAFRAGASGYVTKHEGPIEIARALESAFQGQTFVSKAVSALLVADNGVNPSRKDFSLLESLSNREFHIFRRLGRKQGVTAMARELGVSVKTIETHQRRIKEKLLLRTSFELHILAQRWTTTVGSAK